MDAFLHESVMTRETLDFLRPRAGGIYADATLGAGGHTKAILDASAPTGRVVSVDRDPQAIAHAQVRLAEYGDRASILHGEFRDLPELLKNVGVAAVDGLVADLGVSSPQLDEARRGFSFQQDGPLDMRMDSSQGETVLELIERLTEKELADVIYQYGEERRSRAIARSIRAMLAEGTLATTADLRRAVIKAIGRPPGSKIDPATRTFQALRIATNDELSQLDGLLEALPDLLADGGTAVIISFHSLEDRSVKHAFRSEPRLSIMTKRPLLASDDEQAQNRRARSAKLRAARRITREAAEVGT
jgi:16S rRNA (cytosine1402-N4)-methyltransferase